MTINGKCNPVNESEESEKGESRGLSESGSVFNECELPPELLDVQEDAPHKIVKKQMKVSKDEIGYVPVVQELKDPKALVKRNQVSVARVPTGYSRRKEGESDIRDIDFRDEKRFDPFPRIRYRRNRKGSQSTPGEMRMRSKLRKKWLFNQEPVLSLLEGLRPGKLDEFAGMPGLESGVPTYMVELAPVEDEDAGQRSQIPSTNKYYYVFEKKPFKIKFIDFVGGARKGTVEAASFDTARYESQSVRLPAFECTPPECREVLYCKYFQCNSLGFFPDSRNIRKYFFCDINSNGFVLYHMLCPRGRIFDPKIRECRLEDTIATSSKYEETLKDLIGKDSVNSRKGKWNTCEFADNFDLAGKTSGRRTNHPDGYKKYKVWYVVPKNVMQDIIYVPCKVSKPLWRRRRIAYGNGTPIVAKIDGRLVMLKDPLNNFGKRMWGNQRIVKKFADEPNLPPVNLTSEPEDAESVREVTVASLAPVATPELDKANLPPSTKATTLGPFWSTRAAVDDDLVDDEEATEAYEDQDFDDDYDIDEPEALKKEQRKKKQDETNSDYYTGLKDSSSLNGADENEYAMDKKSVEVNNDSKHNVIADRGKRSEMNSTSATENSTQSTLTKLTEEDLEKAELPEFEKCYNEQKLRNLDGYPCKQYGRYPDRFDSRSYYECGVQPDGNMKIEHRRCPTGEEFSPEFLECVNSGFLKITHRKRRLPECSNSKTTEPPTEPPEYNDEEDKANEWLDAPKGSKVPNEFKMKTKQKLRIFHLHCRRDSDKNGKSKRKSAGCKAERAAARPKKRDHNQRARSFIVRENKKSGKSEHQEKVEEEDDEDDEDYDEEYEEERDENVSVNIVQESRTTERSYSSSGTTEVEVVTATDKISDDVPSNNSSSNKVILDANIQLGGDIGSALRSILEKKSEQARNLLHKGADNSITMKVSTEDKSGDRSKRNFIKDLFSKKTKDGNEDSEKGVVSMMTLINGLPSEYERDALLQKLERRKMVSPHLPNGRARKRKRKKIQRENREGDAEKKHNEIIESS